MLMLLLLSAAMVIFIALFDINDYSAWLTTQIEKRTGYQVSVEEITMADWLNPQLTLSAVAIGYQDQPLLTFDRLEIKSRQLDLRHRHLEIASVELQGLHVWWDERNLSELNHAPQQPIKQTPRRESLLPWNSLTIDKVAIVDANVQIHYQDTNLQLQQLDLSSEHLTLISNNQFIYSGMQGNWQAALKEANWQLQNDRFVRLNDFTLHTNFDLIALQAQLMLAVRQISVITPEFSDVVDDAQLSLQLENSKLILQRLFARIFTGELQLQGEATFAFNPLSNALIAVQNVTLSSLEMKDMQIHIPQRLTPSKSITSSEEKTVLPISSFFIKYAHLDNIDISSADAALPLQLKKGRVQIDDLQFVENNQLIKFWHESEQQGNVSVKFAYLQWEDTIIEAFQMIFPHKSGNKIE